MSPNKNGNACPEVLTEKPVEKLYPILNQPNDQTPFGQPEYFNGQPMPVISKPINFEDIQAIF